MNRYSSLSPDEAAILADAYSLLSVRVLADLTPIEYQLATDESISSLEARIRKLAQRVADHSADVVENLDALRSLSPAEEGVLYFLQSLYNYAEKQALLLASLVTENKERLGSDLVVPPPAHIAYVQPPRAYGGGEISRIYERLALGALERALPQYRFQYDVRFGAYEIDGLLEPVDVMGAKPIVVAVKSHAQRREALKETLARLQKMQKVVGRGALGLLICPSMPQQLPGVMKEQYVATYNVTTDEFDAREFLRAINGETM